MSGAPATPPIRAVWMGRVDYEDAYRLQLSLLERRKIGEIPDTLLLLEHPHVYTLGRRGADADLLAGAEEIEASGASVVYTDRGGQATYHGPGQLVGYPILDLKESRLGPVSYVRLLEEIIIGFLGSYGVEGHRVDGKTGVWSYGSTRPDPASPLAAGEAKIASIGVRISRGVTMHGFAVNISTDLAYFGRIVPCGIPGLRLASVSSICGETPGLEESAGAMAKKFGQVFGRPVENRAPEPGGVMGALRVYEGCSRLFGGVVCAAPSGSLPAIERPLSMPDTWPAGCRAINCNEDALNAWEGWKRGNRRLG